MLCLFLCLFIFYVFFCVKSIISQEIQPVHSKGDQPWVFFGRNDAKAETPVLWPPHEKSWLIGKDSDAGRDWGQEEKGITEDEIAGWHHRLNGREFELNSRRWWWTGRPDVLQFMGSQKVGHDWATELNWTELMGENRITEVGNYLMCIFWGAPKSLQMVTAAMKLKDSCSLEEKLWPT